MTYQRWFWYGVAFIVFIILFDEYLYKNFKLAFRGEHWWHLLGQKTPLQNWTDETGDAQLNTYTRLRS